MKKKSINSKLNKIVLLVAGFFLFGSITSCKKLIEIKPSSTQLLSSVVFADSVTVQSALAGMYVTFSPQGGLYRSALSIFPGFSADELQYLGSTYDPYINNALLSTDANVSAIWSNSYSTIYNANSIIEGVSNGTGISAGFKNQALAEAMFMRAFCYFHLINIFGDVPLILNTDVAKNSLQGRTASANIYTQIVSDLQFAQNNLPADYSISGNTRTRINKWVATAMLARVYLYTGDWINAETQSTSVINNTALFSLPADLAKVFTPTSTEAIWQLYNDANGYTWYAFTVLPNAVSKIPTYVLNPLLVNAFEAGDARKTNWTATLLYSGVTYTYPYKYKSLVSGANAEYYTILRLGEQYLIRAEARAQQNNVSGSQADVSTIRNRAGLANTTAASKASLLLAIEQERRVELS
jgi:hypothetical protein